MGNSAERKDMHVYLLFEKHCFHLILTPITREEFNWKASRETKVSLDIFCRNIFYLMHTGSP